MATSLLTPMPVARSGNLIAQSSPSGTAYGFTGEAHDTVTNLVYLRARYYNSNLRLFMSTDPVRGFFTRPASQHGYSYTHNNPVNHTDPTGNCIFTGIDTLICLGAGIAIGAGIGFASNIAIQTGTNMYFNDMNFIDAINYKNIDWVSAFASTFAGGASGGFGAILPSTGLSLSAIMAYGGLDGFLTGLLEQAVINAFSECREFDEGLLTTAISSGVAGALTAGVFDVASKQASGIAQSIYSKFGGTTTFYHGTSSEFASKIRTSGIDLTKGNPWSDFGQGFYLSESSDDALKSATRIYGNNDIEVVQFDILNSELSTLDHLNFDSPSSNWMDFTRFHKMYSPNQLIHGGIPYDIVSGPMVRRIRSNGQVLHWEGLTQFSIHTQKVVELFNRNIVR